MIFLLKSEVFSFIRWLSSNQGSYFGIFASIFIHKKGGDSLTSPCSVCEKCNPSRDYHPNSSIWCPLPSRRVKSGKWCPPWGCFCPGFPWFPLSNQSTAPPVHEIACYIETQSRRRWQCPLCGIHLRNGGASRFGDVSHQAQKDVYGLLKSNIYIYMYIIVYDYICICNMYIYVYIYMGLGLVGRKNIMNTSCWESEEPPNISSQAGLWHQPSCPAAQLPSSHTVPHHQSWHLVRNNSSCPSVNVLCTALAQFCLGHHVFARRKKVRNQKWKTQHWLHVEFSHVATPNQASFAGAHHYHDSHWETDHAKGCLMTFLHDEPQVA